MKEPRFVFRFYQKHTGSPFPADPYVQLELAIQAVFRSSMGRRVVDYRRELRITALARERLPQKVLDLPDRQHQTQRANPQGPPSRG